MAPYFFGDAFRRAHPQMVEDFFAREAGAAACRGHYAASREHDTWDHLGAISDPLVRG